MARNRTPEEEKAHKLDMMRTLLKKAETTTPEEAEVVMEKVERLMLELGLDDIMQISRDRTKETVGEMEFVYTGGYAKAFVSMTYCVIRALGDLEAIASNVHNKQGKKIGLKLIVVGFEGDCNRARILVTSLALQCVTASTAHMNQYKMLYGYTATGTDKYNEKRSFIMGFGEGAATRIRRTRAEVVEEATASTPGTALVLADRNAIVKSEFDARFADRRKTRATSIRSGGYESGVRAGRQARTGIESEVGGSSRKAIG